MNPIRIEVEYSPGYQDMSREDWLHVRVETEGRVYSIHEIVHHSVAISTLEYVWDKIFRCMKDSVLGMENKDGIQDGR